MSRLSQTSITTKLVLIMSLSSGVALLFSSAAFWWRDVSSAEDIQAITDLGASQIAPLIEEGRYSDAEKLIDGLCNQPHVQRVEVKTDKPMFRDVSFATGVEDFADVTSTPIATTAPIFVKGRQVGELKLNATYNFGSQRLVRFLVIASVVMFSSLAVAVVLGGSLGVWFSSPLIRLAATAHQISEGGDYSLRVDESAQGEIGELCRNFNQMLSRVEAGEQSVRSIQARLEDRVTQRTQELISSNERLTEEMTTRTELSQKLIESSHAAGMAEVANNVLHNVGNVLNSVNVSASLIRESVRGSEVADLLQVLEMIEDRQDELGTFLTRDPRGAQIPAYFQYATQLLQEERQALMHRSNELCRNVDHVIDIIATQQSYSGLSGLNQEVAIDDLLEDALQINGARIAAQDVQVSRDFSGDTTITVDKQKVLQILINLVKNAVNALNDVVSDEGDETVAEAAKQEGFEPQLCLTIVRNEDTIQIQIRDNGIGIESENLARIFQHGFTTRPSGHGFGLHSAAIAATELGGSLNVKSDGPGQGAEFHLHLPVKPLEVQKESNQTAMTV